jgi:HTH-type transcriptional regulator, cell division transcriptional repressor
MKIYWYKGGKNIIGQRIKEARQKQLPKMTQEDLAAKLELMDVNIDRIAVSRIESGKRFIADYEAIAIARALKVSVAWLFGEEK